MLLRFATALAVLPAPLVTYSSATALVKSIARPFSLPEQGERLQHFFETHQQRAATCQHLDRFDKDLDALTYQRYQLAPAVIALVEGGGAIEQSGAAA